MVMYSRQKSRLWASILLLALLFAQPVLAEHIHMPDKSHQLCELCASQMPAAPGSEYQAYFPPAVFHYFTQSEPVPGDCQPERQSARAPPVSLSHR